MEKIQKVLVLGDSQVGKTQLLQSLFDSQTSQFNANSDIFSPFEYQEKVDKEQIRPSIGCEIHSYLLNEFYPKLDQKSV